MIEFGKTLRAAREARGLTIQQIAETTHMMASIIEDLENENFTKIAAPIYGRGFVKLYCATVGLESAPLVAEFMEIFNGNHTVAIRERPISGEEPAPPPPKPAESAAPLPAEEPIPTPPPIAKEPILRTPEPAKADPDDLFSYDPNAAVPTPVAAESRSELKPDVEEQPRKTLSRYISPLQERTRQFVPPHFWRLLVVAAGGLLLLIGMIAGFRAVYRATSPAAKPTPETAAPAPAQAQTPAQAPAPKPARAQAPKPAEKKAAPRAARTPQKIPALYID